MFARELVENGPRSTRKTKCIVTVGPACADEASLERLAEQGMNVARLNMCHNDHDWHRHVIKSIRTLNERRGFSVAVMIDTEGSEVRCGDGWLAASTKVEVGDEYTFTVRQGRSPLDADDSSNVVPVNYDGLIEDVEVGDRIVVDGGMVIFEVREKAGPDVKCECVDSGVMLNKANLTFRRGSDGEAIRGKNAALPTITAKDWMDIEFAIVEKADFICVSFVKSADVLTNLRSFVAARSPEARVAVVAKIESFDAVPNLEAIVRASDGVMVARGDLGAQIPFEQVPEVQAEIVRLCRLYNKPVIVASHLLESMIEHPIPTRAEVSDISEAVSQGADALMLSGETAVGEWPLKTLEVLCDVARRNEENHSQSGRLFRVGNLPLVGVTPQDVTNEHLCLAAAGLSQQVGADAIFVYTKRGFTASLLSRCRPNCPIFAFTDSPQIRRRMNILHGVIPFRLWFDEEPETNVQKTFALLLHHGLVKTGDTIVTVSDVGWKDTQRRDQEPIRSIQVRQVPPMERFLADQVPSLEQEPEAC